MKSSKTRIEASAKGRVSRGKKPVRADDFRVDESGRGKIVNQVDEDGRQEGENAGLERHATASGQEAAGAAEKVKAPRRVESRKELPGPRTLQVQNRMRALRLVNRFRQLRAIDLAAGLFPEREFKAALSAAQRLTKGLVALKMLLRYRSLSGQTYYALGEAGARWLRQNGNESDSDVKASASRACEKTNPEHDLWAAFVVLACEARGLRAQSEKELMPLLLAGKDLSRRRHVLSVFDERGQVKGLMPDAIADDGKNVVWFEVDRSERGSGRLTDLISLCRSCGRGKSGQ
jgi:hypothetical protein